MLSSSHASSTTTTEIRTATPAAAVRIALRHRGQRQFVMCRNDDNCSTWIGRHR